MADGGWTPEWCITGNLLPYPYSPNGPHANFRSQKIFPAGAKLYVVGGFGGDGYETITVIGYGHRRRSPVTAHIRAKYVGAWRAELVYRPVILRTLHAAYERQKHICHRWLYDPDKKCTYEPGDPEYGRHLERIAAIFQRRLHGSEYDPGNQHGR